ncbi:MAG TPA: hypothetical protein VNY36_05560, partial [Bacteroidia bacterium]|nr:hypothetical protein [Bacteroidia bacterium]
RRKKRKPRKQELTQKMSYTYKYDKTKNLVRIDGISMYLGEDKPVRDSQHVTMDYDKKNRVVLQMQYAGNKLQTSTAKVYGSDGGRTETTEEYGEPSPGSCIPNHTTSINQYDSSGNSLSEYVITISSGDTNRSRTSYIRKYSGKNITSLTTASEIIGTMFYRRSTDIETYTYSDAGDMIKAAHRGGRYYSGHNSTYTYKYNAMHKETEQCEYGPCMDAPIARYTTTYYPNDTVMKEKHETRSYYSSSQKYDERGNNIEYSYVSRYTASETVNQYVYREADDKKKGKK